jgi:hypothetical protein
MRIAEAVIVVNEKRKRAMSRKVAVLNLAAMYEEKPLAS